MTVARRRRTAALALVAFVGVVLMLWGVLGMEGASWTIHR